ncbi:trimethylamine methyltransferase family protein [Dehalobacterium formicoaceticum]|uniref:Methyltransferase n=1 Tax=Dehalobacterium formicoaceticum TaxID=51515 RepID=A0ABT1Y679_9FIRM|nr:trimethylamine methyltransferase family protein [Dehalobacterium formicoaceticum]MCR6546372.1 trimethylamine methyltransferase family protein [Dehalobacterium formicoaceticum]
MIPKFDVLTKEEVSQIHEKTMEILETVGVEFTYDPAIAIFKEWGQRIEGHRVYFQRSFVEEMVQKAPASFTLHARNPEKNVQCNHRDIIFTPSYGPPYIYEANGNRRYSNMNDYDNIVKLAGASTNIQATGGNVCEPNDVPDEIKHLKMIYSHIKNADKNFMGSAYGEMGAQDSIEMASMLFGGRDILKKNPALITLINSITPLKYDDRMLAAMMTYAAAGQVNLISSLVMSGSTGPATMAGTITLQNAEVLAGIVLTQCINPGAPVIYGSTSGPADMRTVSLSIGNAETALYTAASAQMARFYGVPSRGGGGLNDSKTVDAQAGYEAMMVLMSAAISGINYVLHAAGIMHYYTAFSFEKFVMDDEIAGMVLKYRKGYDFSDEMFALNDIKEVGPGGHFLYQASTLEKHRQELRMPDLSDRMGYEAWDADGRKDTNTRAKERWQKILAEYEVPHLDEALDKELCAFIERRSQELMK